MWESENEMIRGRDYRNGIRNSNKDGVKNDGFELKGQSWYVTSEIASDVLVQVGDISFHLHKYPLLSRSGKLNRIIYGSPNHDINKVTIDDLPGGAKSFELASKFCYGIPIDLRSSNISCLRCAAEYLEMTEDLDEGNLIFKTEAFLSYVVLSSWKDSITVIQTCESLSPWAEDLQIVRRCSDSIAWKACANPKTIKWAYTKSGSEIQECAPQDWWFEDVSLLRIDHFIKVINAIKVKGVGFELIGSSIIHYAKKWLPGITQQGSSSLVLREPTSVNDRDDPTRNHSKLEQKTIIESLISIIPPQKNSVSCTFLLRLLKIANRLQVAHALINELEKRIGMQFEQATVSDLLIPLFGLSRKKECLYDVDLVQRLVEHFLVQEHMENLSSDTGSFSGKTMFDQGGLRSNAKIKVARIVDSYLSEISRDGNLCLTKFHALAEALPESARDYDDGLYRAVDSYLKAHPTLSELERKRLCRVMNCKKLSIDACMHAALNERLPLRIVLQVLFSEQLKISNAIANTSLNNNTTNNDHQPIMITNRKTLLEGTQQQSFHEDWASAKKNIDALKFDVETVKTKYVELRNEIENLRTQVEKANKQKPVSAWSNGWRKLSKITKMGSLESDDKLGSAVQNGEAHTKKGPRRWRNSIS